ncbi:MAG: HD domain-containing protein [Desulforhopalus sp.]
MNSVADKRSPGSRPQPLPPKDDGKKIPAISQCLEFIEVYEMLDNIRAHSFVVARIAETLVDGLYTAGKSTGPFANRDEVIAGALLHDIAKSLCLKTDCLHAETGRDICLELGYPDISEIVAEHVILKNYTNDLYQKGIFGAKELVFYADKRVLHDQVVSLDDRLDYILERYGKGDPVREQRIRENFSQAQELESYLFSFLDFNPEDIRQHMSHKIFLPDD